MLLIYSNNAEGSTVFPTMSVINTDFPTYFNLYHITLLPARGGNTNITRDYNK